MYAVLTGAVATSHSYKGEQQRQNKNNLFHVRFFYLLTQWYTIGFVILSTRYELRRKRFTAL